MRRLLVLRPEPSATATVEKARQQGLDAFALPLFEIHAVAWEAPDPSGFDGLLLTSANAVRHGGDRLQSLRGLPAYAVGEMTATAARDAGFDVKAVGNAGIDRLLGSIHADLRLLHLTGEDRKEASSTLQRITPIAVYRADPAGRPHLAEAGGTVALIHSPRAGQRFAELVDNRASIAIAAISEGAAAAVGSGWRCVEAAEQPNDDALLALASRLCNTLDPG